MLYFFKNSELQRVAGQHFRVGQCIFKPLFVICNYLVAWRM